MELRQLRYFVAVAKHESFSRASAHLNVAQSALSRQIRLLELELRQELLRRTGRGATPTRIGRLLVRRASALLADADDLKAAVLQSNKVAGKVRLGIPAAFNGSFAATIVQRCQIEYPDIALHLCEATSALLFEWLTNGRIDLAILYSIQAARRDLVSASFDAKPLTLVHSPSIAPCCIEPLTLSQISKLPLIVLERPNGSRLIIDQSFATRNIRPHIAHEVTAWVVFKELLLTGKGYGLLPEAEVQAEIDARQLVGTPVTDAPLTRTLCIAHPNSKAVSAATHHVFELVHRQGLDHNRDHDPRVSIVS
jgi:LysR family nitrogen assimilation transcriptional regulator